jgi:hypothetical protein|nr:MAG: internal scaffolding protein [Microviridae sp.]
MSQLPNRYLSTPNTKSKIPPYSLLFDDADRPSLTKQAPADEANINNIVNRFLATGSLPEMLPPQYGDLTLAPDLVTALQTQANANAAWASLPPQIRAIVGAPQNFESWIHDPDNVPLAVKYGLATVTELPSPPKPPEAPPAPPAAK